MSSDCNTPNPLVRDGTSQQSRALAKLDPASTPVDDRSLLDLVRFVRDYSREITYYDAQNNASGSWEPFFSSNVLATIVAIDEFSIAPLKKAYEQLQHILLDDTASATQLKKHFKTYFDLLFTGYNQIDNWYYKATEKSMLQTFLSRMIKSDLRIDFTSCLEAYKEAKSGVRLLEEGFFDPSLLDAEYEDSESLITKSYQEIWISDSAESWEDYFAGLTADASIYGDHRNDVKDAIRQASLFLNKFMERQLSFFAQLSHKAEAFLLDVVENHGGHEPHLGLLLSFLQLFKYNQDQLNGITKRHLDFYYKEVLKLDKKPARPDHVHLLFELANSRTLTSYLVGEGTILKAGKDAVGKDVQYKTDNDLIVNRAYTDDFRSIFIDPEDRIYSAPVANSADGMGKELEEGAAWKAFGEPQLDKGKDEMTLTATDVGLLIQSRTLMLQEGKRTIDLTLNLEGLNNPSDHKTVFDVYLTSAEGWLHLEPTYKESLAESDQEGIAYSSNKLKIRLTLGSDKPAVTLLNPEVHGFETGSTLPVMKVICSDRSGTYSYHSLRNKKLTGATLEVSANLTNLILQNDTTVLDPAAPFMPFGPQPSLGSNFIIGSRELLSKNLTSLKLDGSWVDKPDLEEQYENYDQDPDIEESSFKVKLKGLKNGNWEGEKLGNEKVLFSTDALDLSIESEYLMENATDSGEIDPYSISTKRGFLKLELTSPEMAFGHKKYPDLYARKTVQELNKTLDGDAGTVFNQANLPKPPYTPLLKDFSISYSAKEVIDLASGDQALFEGRNSKVFHLHPFGFGEIHPYLFEDIYLLPQFSHLDKGTILRHQGTFLVGFDKLKPKQSLTLFVNVDEGSEDPEADTEDLYWFYLAKDRWKAFERTAIVKDTTNGLLQTGIIEFAIPRDISEDHSLMPAGKHWIKAIISNNYKAVCNVVSISTQAVKATFNDQGNDPEFLAEPLPKETINKLKNRVSAIKGITQPMASFGGSTVEKDRSFYRRVSERLRHKNRSITIWDYERIVLEEFPEVYKARTINHSTYGYPVSEEKSMTSEFAPGYVSVILIPNLTNRSVVDPYKPRLSKAALEKVKAFLQAKMSGWCADTLQVLNPKFEEIQVDFQVEFKSADWGFYAKKLNEDLKRFLAPWAYQSNAEILFGGKLHRSVLLNHVEERDYVDYVREFKMNHWVDGALLNANIEEIYPTSSRSVFTSIARDDYKNEHLIKEIE